MERSKKKILFEKILSEPSRRLKRRRRRRRKAEPKGDVPGLLAPSCRPFSRLTLQETILFPLFSLIFLTPPVVLRGIKEKEPSWNMLHRAFINLNHAHSETMRFQDRVVVVYRCHFCSAAVFYFYLISIFTT